MDDGDAFDTEFPSLNQSHSHSLPKNSGSVNLLKTPTISQLMSSPVPTEQSDKPNDVADKPVCELFVSLPEENASSPSKDSSVTAAASSEAIIVKLDNISQEIRGLRETLGNVQKSLLHNQSEIDNMKQTMSDMQSKQAVLERSINNMINVTISQLKRENKDLQVRLERQEIYSRRENLLICGISETTNENTEKVVRDFFKSTLKEDPDSIAIARCHRTGAASGKKGERNLKRPIIVRFQNLSDRTRVWNKRNELKGKDIWMKEDYPAVTERKRRQLYPILQEARRRNMKAKLATDSLVIEGTTYTITDLDKLPKELQPENLCTITTEKHVLFYGRSSIFSNFRPCQLQMEGITFNCVEQAFQYRKALAAKDMNAAKEILSEEDPATQKGIGDKIQITEDWEKCKFNVMCHLVKAKFDQHRQLKEKLLSTKGKTFVECNPYDKYWGSGMKLRDIHAADTSRWTGKNQMGHCLGEVRTALSRS